MLMELKFFDNDDQAAKHYCCVWLRLELLLMYMIRVVLAPLCLK